ncbi:MAG TPA: phasin family protein, partial [Usitatibacter sp.]|nr:phasin family protein [Usitatibacter sp.]
MAQKKKRTRRTSGRADGAKAVRDSAQKIWLAGLGAFERAKTEGPRMFDALVEQGRNMGARAVGMADQALKTMRESEYGGRFDKLEKVFEERVSGSLKRLGVLTADQVDELARQVRELNDRLQAYGVPAGAARGKARGRTAGAKRAGASHRTAKRAKGRARTASRSRAK